MISLTTLANGLRVIVVENHRLPFVAAAAIHLRAGAREDGAHPGLAALTADVIDEGTGFETSVASDYASQHFVTTPTRLDRDLERLAFTVATPQVHAAVIDRVRTRRVRELAERRQRPRTLAAQIFDRVVFGGHAYGVPADGLPTTVAAIGNAMVETFARHAYAPEATWIVLAGDVTLAGARKLVEARLGTWRGSEHKPVAPPLSTPPPQLAYVDTPGASDAVVLVGTRAAAAAGDTRELAADVANAILGGGTDARLDRVLHAERGYTFGASASFWRGQLAGAWTAAATFRTEVAADALRAMLELVETARTTEPSTEELARARANLARGTTLSFETMAGTVRAVERLVVLGRPLDWYATLETRLAALTPSDVRAAVTDVWRDLSIVIVGDWSKLGGALHGVGPRPVAYTAGGIRTP